MDEPKDEWTEHAGNDNDVASGDFISDFAWKHAFIRPDTNECLCACEYEDEADVEQHNKNQFLFEHLLHNNLALVKDDIQNGANICANHERYALNAIGIALVSQCSIEIILYLLNHPAATEAVKYESKDGETILSLVTDYTPLVVMELLLFMGAPGQNSKGTFFWENSCSRANRVNKKKWQQLENKYMARRDALYNSVTFTREIFSVLLSFCADCIE